jgi:hypothetical protein
VMIGSSGSGKGGSRETLTFLNSYFGWLSFMRFFRCEAWKVCAAL